MSSTSVPPSPVKLWSSFTDIIEGYPGSGIREILRLLPDGLFIGSGLFALITQNYAIAILFATLFEILFINIGLQKLAGYIDLPNTVASTQAKGCRSGFQSPTLEYASHLFKMDATSSFPSPPVFVTASAISYMIFALQTFADELSELGPAYSARYYTSVVLSSILLFIVSLFRLVNGCDTFGIVLMSLIFGFCLGLVLSWQNYTLLGKSALNVLNIPYFSKTTADGKPIYICPT